MNEFTFPQENVSQMNFLKPQEMETHDVRVFYAWVSISSTGSGCTHVYLQNLTSVKLAVRHRSQEVHENMSSPFAVNSKAAGKGPNHPGRRKLPEGSPTEAGGRGRLISS
jgi:hypothetical protein